MPEPSCPGTHGSCLADEYYPSINEVSLGLMGEESTLTRTSPALGMGVSMSLNTAGFPNYSATIAFIILGI